MRALLFGDAREGLGEDSAWRAIDQACCAGMTLDKDLDEFEVDAQSTSTKGPFVVDDSEVVANSDSCLVGSCSAPRASCMTGDAADSDEADAALALRVRQLEEALASADAEKQQLLAWRDKKHAASRSDKTPGARQEAGGGRASSQRARVSHELEARLVQSSLFAGAATTSDPANCRSSRPTDR